MESYLAACERFGWAPSLKGLAGWQRTLPYREKWKQIRPVPDQGRALYWRDPRRRPSRAWITTAAPCVGRSSDTEGCAKGCVPGAAG